MRDVDINPQDQPDTLMEMSEIFIQEVKEICQSVKRIKDDAMIVD